MNYLFKLSFNKGSQLLFGSLFLVSFILGQDFTYPGKINPHGTEACSACHTSNKEPSQANYAQSACTQCHSAKAVNARIHSLFDLNPKAANMSIPADFPMDKVNEVSCLTCHQVSCKTDRANRAFLRGGPYRKELDFCYSCHDQALYERENPHEQLRADGSTDSGTCLHCHARPPSLEDHPLISREMHLGMEATCNKCHALHEHENSHLGLNVEKAQKTTLAHIRKTEKLLNIQLPLSPNNEIQCNTCHYIHGSLGIDHVIYETSGENEHYLRIPKVDLCYACHNL